MPNQLPYYLPLPHYSATQFPLAWGILGSQPFLWNFQKDTSKAFTIFHLILSLIFILSEIIILSLKEDNIRLRVHIYCPHSKSKCQVQGTKEPTMLMSLWLSAETLDEVPQTTSSAKSSSVAKFMAFSCSKADLPSPSE